MVFGMDIVIAFILCLCTGIWLWRSRGGTIPPGLKQVPGPSGLPLLGNLPQIDRNKFHTFFTQWMAEYGHIFSISLPGTKMVMINDNELLREVSTKIIHRPFNFQGFLIYDDSAITFSSIKGNQPAVRKMFIDGMHESLKRATRIEELERDETARFVRNLVFDCDIDFFSVVSESVARQFAIILTGKESNARQSEVILDYGIQADALFEGGLGYLLTMLPVLRYVPGKLKNVYESNSKFMKTMVNLLLDDASEDDYEHGVIKSFIDFQEKNNAEDGAMIITDDNVHGCIVNVVSGGLAAIKGQITITILCVLQNPDVQNKIQDEMATVCTDGPPADNTRLPYLEATILESWRYNSLVATTAPHLSEDDVDIGGFHIPGGTSVFGNIWNIHHDEQIWGDPWVFRPERWLTSSGELLPASHQLRKSLLPFGTGVRSCKGKDFATSTVYRYLSNVLYELRLLPPSDEHLPNYDPRTFRYGAALFVPEFYCRVERRDDRI